MDSKKYPDDISYDSIKLSDEEAMNNWRNEAIKIITEGKEKGSYEVTIKFDPINNSLFKQILALELLERFPISISHTMKRSPIMINKEQWDNCNYLDKNDMIDINVRIRNYH